MKGITNSTVYTLDAGPQMLAVQMEMTKQIVTALKGADNVMIELVFMTDGLSAEWASKIAGAVRAADPTRLIVLPTQWSAQLLKITGQYSVVSCGAGANCTGVAGYSLPPTSSYPTLVDSSGPSGAVTNASNTTATRAKGTVLLTAYRRTYWGFMLSGGASVYNLGNTQAICRCL